MAGYLIDLNDESAPRVPEGVAGVSQEFGGPSVGRGVENPAFGEGGSLQRFAQQHAGQTPASAAQPVVSVSPPAERAAVYENSVIRGKGTLQGPLQSAAAAAPVGIAAGSQMPAPVIGNAPPSTYDADRTKAALDAYAAREAQDLQSRNAAMQGNANWASAWTANRDAQNAARVAAFRATNGADMVLGGPSAAYDEQRKAILTDAVAKGARAVGAETDLAKAQAAQGGPPRNYIDEFGKLQNTQSLETTAKSRLIEANARATEAGSRGELERAQAAGIKLNNEQHQKILTLSAAMGAAKTPEEVQKYERQILALAGKSGEDWGAIHLAGRTSTNAMGFPEKESDTVLLFNKRTGERISLGGASGGQSAPSALDMATLKANSGNKEIYDGFVKRFGEDAAKRVLGK